ncbi:MAG: hypothetical protein JWR24_3730 [Actinoallomurus sp.]|jgi:hypothetical protein|nr:hypothetical protein [Actinoallomurus sp.]
MAVKLNTQAFEFAKRLINEKRVVLDSMDDWSEHQPSAQQENEFIEKHGFGEYQKWHLGVDDEHNENTKSRYKFPYGDFDKVHRCGVIAAEVRSGQQKYQDIENAAVHLRGMLDKLM